MSRFHINSKGEAAPCSADKRACPLGGEHYDTMQDAAMAALEAEMGIVPDGQAEHGHRTVTDYHDLIQSLSREEHLAVFSAYAEASSLQVSEAIWQKHFSSGEKDPRLAVIEERERLDAHSLSDPATTTNARFLVNLAYYARKSLEEEAHLNYLRTLVPAFDSRTATEQAMLASEIAYEDEQEAEFNRTFATGYFVRNASPWVPEPPTVESVFDVDARTRMPSVFCESVAVPMELSHKVSQGTFSDATVRNVVVDYCKFAAKLAPEFTATLNNFELDALAVAARTRRMQAKVKGTRGWDELDPQAIQSSRVILWKKFGVDYAEGVFEHDDLVIRQAHMQSRELRKRLKALADSLEAGGDL